jgi:hypothetical protein
MAAREMPPAITRARLGSQDPATSRKPLTFSGSVIPLNIRPMPNKIPKSVAIISFMMLP